jgi:hypothetical protein
VRQCCKLLLHRSDVQITKAVDKKAMEISDDSTTMTKSRYIEITFEATDVIRIGTTQCSLDGQAFTSSCTSPVTYDKLSKGTHQFTARATDAAAGKDAIL